MSLVVECMAEACRLEGVPSFRIEENGSVLILPFDDGKRVVVNTHLGLLTDAEWRLFRDKFYTYCLFGGKDFFPKTRAYIDPGAPKRFQAFVTFPNIEAIVEDIEANFTYPVMVKRNSGTQGQNVYRCGDSDSVRTALKRIYSKKQTAYDHVALAQTYLKPAVEYRLVVYESKLEFAYVKPHRLKQFGGKSEPQIVADRLKIRRMEELVSQLCHHYPLLYAGLDIVESAGGEFRVIEINGSPTYSRFIQTNGTDLVVTLFRKIVRQLSKR